MSAPVAIFAHRRPEHLNRLINSLHANEPFARSPVFIFCDGPRSESERLGVEQTRAVARDTLGSRAEIIESAANKGLARSIIDGVTQITEHFGRVIVLEDDLVLHPGCLSFLNAALERYEHEPRVYHVNAYRYPLPPSPAPAFSRLSSSWGWATWRRAWQDFEPDAAELSRRLVRQGLVRAFDFQGTFPYHRMLENQVLGKVDSWAIRWYASILLKGGLAVVPNAAQASNHGFDNSGVHCGTTSKFDVELGEASRAWPQSIAEDPVTFREMKAFFRSVTGTLPIRMARKLKELLSAH